MSEDNKDKGAETRQPPALIQYSYLAPLDEIDPIMEQFFHKRGWFSPYSFYRPTWVEIKSPIVGIAPRINIINHENELEVIVELPGIKKDNIDVKIFNDVLTIKATTTLNEKNKKVQYLLREIIQSDFVRTIKLPVHIDATSVIANYTDGLLILTLPKAVVRKKHSIDIE